MGLPLKSEEPERNSDDVRAAFSRAIRLGVMVTALPELVLPLAVDCIVMRRCRLLVSLSGLPPAPGLVPDGWSGVERDSGTLLREEGVE